MKRNPYLYIRGLRKVDHTVFAVNDGQKFYYDPQFGYKQAYSSGQQVKRSILDALNLPFAAITFNWEIENYGKKDKEAAKQKEPHSPCDPSFADQLLGGYMKAESGAFTVKRRSPLSISAMRPIHPLLGGIESPTENLTFDRTQYPEHHVVNVYKVENSKRVLIEKEELDKWLTENHRSLPNRAFIQDQKRTSGLFVYDIAIDLRTLFCVSTNKYEPELFPEIEEKLKGDGWVETSNVFGKCLLCPDEKRKEIIESLAHAIINWRITSNQARTFSLMETIAIAMSDNANKVAFAIRGELSDTTERPTANPVIDENSGAEIFQTPLVSSIIPGFAGSSDALDKAKQYIIDYLNKYDYVNQKYLD
ncbi:MAG: CRISPR-associated protein Cas7 [Candidatus Kapabacteria bacterium]|nr:CRISPR-associated protein Cas7 [Ignavibacteriota bacterium]MCW5883401.1 CRISPR-associated protein Cas7 [Candidatus Kapabacteria bacterium]